jgi:hypothetical protein
MENVGIFWRALCRMENVGIFWRALCRMENVGIFCGQLEYVVYGHLVYILYGHFVYFVVIWYMLILFWYVAPNKPCNPAHICYILREDDLGFSLNMTHNLTLLTPNYNSDFFQAVKSPSPLKLGPNHIYYKDCIVLK